LQEVIRQMSEPEASGHNPERLLQQIVIFTDVARATASSLGLESILQTIMDGLAEFFRPTSWSLLRVDEQKNELYFVITDGDTPAPIKKTRLKIGEGIAGWVAMHDESLIVPDVYDDPRFAKRLEEMAKWNTRSIICVPLYAGKRVLGVIQLINCAEESFTEREMFFLHAICDYAAIAVDYKS
jgi:GAF domain-containing protein